MDREISPVSHCILLDCGHFSTLKLSSKNGGIPACSIRTFKIPNTIAETIRFDYKNKDRRIRGKTTELYK